MKTMSDESLDYLTYEAEQAFVPEEITDRMNESIQSANQY